MIALIVIVSLVLVFFSATINSFVVKDRHWLQATSIPRFQAVADVPSSGRINKLIELSNDKVVNMVSIGSGEKCVICRCWKSGKFPYCDGAHVKHNAETGDNVGPAVISAK
eukprot:gene12365-16587_t